MNECKDQPAQSEDKQRKQYSSIEGISLHKELNRIPEDVIQREFTKNLQSKTSKMNLCFRSEKILSLKIKEVEFIKKLRSLGGEFFQYDSIYICILFENAVYDIEYKISMEDSAGFRICIRTEKFEDIEKEVSKIISTFQDYLQSKNIFCSLQWIIVGADGRHTSKYIRENIEDMVYEEAYPYLEMDTLIDSYLEGTEPILILSGPPGTGKTRLIRYILKKIALRKPQADNRYQDYECSTLYTCNPAIIEQGTIFTEFIIEDYDALVLEDIDNHLKSRNEGNDTMYSLLSSSNGLVSTSLGHKKIILSTNLPNTSKIDEALIRPGRCFSIVSTRKLTIEESEKFLQAVKFNGSVPSLPKGPQEFALSELYRLMKYKTTTTHYEKKNISGQAGELKSPARRVGF